MSEPLAITGIDTDHVGTPRHDGSPGSALYAVPIKLNRRPSGIEAQLLVSHWDNPSSYTMMHRPGIARVVGDTLVLDATTVEEVRDRHARTLALVIDATNADAARHAQAQQIAQDRQDAARVQHAEHVRSVADDIRF
jgi:hypothetical protein